MTLIQEFSQQLKELERLRRNEQRERQGYMLMLAILCCMAIVGTLTGVFVGRPWIGILLWACVFGVYEYVSRLFGGETLYRREFRERVVRPWFAQNRPTTFLAKPSESMAKPSEYTAKPSENEEGPLQSSSFLFDLGLPICARSRVEDRILLDRDPYRTTIFRIKSTQSLNQDFLSSFDESMRALVWLQPRRNPEGVSLIIADPQWIRSRIPGLLAIFFFIQSLCAFLVLILELLSADSWAVSYFFKAVPQSSSVAVYLKSVAALSLIFSAIAIVERLGISRYFAPKKRIDVDLLDPRDAKIFRSLDSWTPNVGILPSEVVLKALRIYNLIKSLAPDRRVALSLTATRVCAVVELNGDLFAPPTAGSLVDGTAYPDWMTDAQLIDSAELRHLLAELG
jgi:hypothetical protein